VSADQRGQPAKRFKTFQPATMTEAAGSLRIHLLDVSLTGALAHAPAPPPSGTRVQVDCGEVSRAGRVCWRDGTRFGLHFDLPLGPEELAGLAPPAPASGASKESAAALA
jgi:hypothetical protein